MVDESSSAIRATRRNALDRLATLAARSPGGQGKDEDIEKLCALGGNHAARTGNRATDEPQKYKPIWSIPMSVRELEVLTALCKAAPSVQTSKDATTLFRQLSPYVPEAHQQVFRPSPFHQRLPPWATLTYDLTAAILALGVNHSSLRDEAWSCIISAVQVLLSTAERTTWLQSHPDGETDIEITDQTFEAIQLTVSLLGFLNAAAENIRLWDLERRMMLILTLRQMLSDKFMTSLEGALSAVRNSECQSRAVKEWKLWIRHYAAGTQPLGAMLLRRVYMKIVEESILALLHTQEPLTSESFLQDLFQKHEPVPRPNKNLPEGILEELTKIIADEMRSLDSEADYVKIGSVWQQNLAREVTASCIRSYLSCALLDPTGKTATSETLMFWLNTIAADDVQMADEELAGTVLKSMAVLARISTPVASELTHSLPRLIVQGRTTAQTATLAGECLARVLKLLSQDIVISTLYSLGNVLSASADTRSNSKASHYDSVVSAHQNLVPQQRLGSAISLVVSDELQTAVIYGTVVQAIVSIAVARSEAQLTALVISMLVQKIGRISKAVDAKIVVETAALGLCGGSGELHSLLRLYARQGAEALMRNDAVMIEAVNEARTRLATWIQKDSPFFELYLVHLLSLCVSSGDAVGDRKADIALGSKTIEQLFRPMALLVATDTEHLPTLEDWDELLNASRDSWFNLVVHGYTLNSAAVRNHLEEFQILALYSLPLVDENRVDMPESGIDLNPVLRRGASPHQLNHQREGLSTALPDCEHDIKGLSYQDCVFLNAALLVSTMRARGGDCTAVLTYFLENKVKITALGNCMLSVAKHSVDVYLHKALAGNQQEFAAPQIALQLATFFEGCCHRISKVQFAAVSACDRIIDQIPSALCQKASIFALLELLSIMWQSCLDADTDEYGWKATYNSKKGNVTLQISDDLNYRQTTLTNFHQRCRSWVSKAIAAAPLDVKGILQAYLEDYEDDGAYGHVALGRSFALEMGATIPSTDQRLTSLERQRNVHVNTASDFVAQYTTRQEYRHVNGNRDADEEWAVVDYTGRSLSTLVDADDAVIAELASLRDLARRIRHGTGVPFIEVRDTLRNAAGILSKSDTACIPLIQDLVVIPFNIFTKASINLGISLWLGIAKENSSLESRILVEVAAGWEASVRLRKGFFHSGIHHSDPFYLKEEFAPSNWESIAHRQQLTHDLIAPHLRLTQYLASHFSASRLTSPSIERVYTRLARITLMQMKETVTQPLAREVHFHIILLALRILKYSTSLSTAAQWRLKDAILSAALSWFRVPPRWSYGSNRLQVKAEVQLLGDVTILLKQLSGLGSKATKSLPKVIARQELLLQLISHEIGRLMVWISPLTGDQKMAGHGEHEAAVKDTNVLPFVATAWAEDPRIAVQLVTRFPHSKRIAQDVRRLLLSRPEQAICEADALYILLGASLLADVKTQLKYLLYWKPINPMAAVTYFLPAYGNHPFVIQYAVRALDSHSVDVTFFYVPQIVQALRYDVLGYVEQYIIETALFSQLFAHQIIWNMKANAYKDEDSQVPDPVKPVLDRVMNAMIGSFSREDRDFYEREFDFFGKVTGISGTLKPFIKRPKPEKKQKIEEELRKIHVDVGVYLPSNPDGVIIGIDRKSGKPLQSHAKAPFMATFRIRKDESEAEGLESPATANGALAKRKTYEAWQSAIFKVGDDCRQDMLALQLVAAFRGIFNSVGLDVYVFPYRVTATAPGCGVIDVLPNSISRDMLGREAVNGLYEYFVSKYGYEDSIRFQQARSNFIKSMAAYSIISYLLQFKDRHNGNIMVDDAGHILHIDFGFCFDIVPGGVKFERAPFKLTPEMVAVMGGSTQSQPFRAFEELCVKVFLASRQYVEQLAHMVTTMLDSGLPCFKPTTVQHFKERFVLDKSDREAAEFVRKLVHLSERSYSTGVYDYYQLLTNGIPY